MRLFLLLLAGAILGPIFDGFHTHSGTLAYTHPWIFQMAWWTPPLFALATVAVTSFTLQCDGFLKRPPKEISWPKVLLGLFIFVLVYYLSGFWSVGSLYKAATFMFISIAFWMKADGTWQGMTEALIVAVIGCSVESFLISLNLFSYTKSDFLNIPYWLGMLYLCAAFALGNLGRKFSTNV